MPKQAHRWVGLSSDYDKIEPRFACNPLGSLQAEIPQLVLLIVDQTHLGSPDLLVDLELFKRDELLLQASSVSLCTPRIRNEKNGRQTRAIRNFIPLTN